MIIIPYYNIVIVPGINLYFQSDYFKEVTNATPEAGKVVTLLMLKENKPRENMREDDFYPIGIAGSIEAVSHEGNVKIRTERRVNIETIEVTAEKIDVTTSNRQDVEDLPEAEAAKHFEKVRTAFASSFQNTPMGMVARNYIRQWDSLGEMAAALSDQMINSNDEKYQILAADTLSERTERMEQAIYQYLEADKVQKEAAAAQQSINEKAYREQALRKQIEILQNQLDEMHPENVSDVRKFEKKIEEAQMNETAHAEAVKVLNRMKQEGQDSHEYGMHYSYKRN